MASKAMSHSEVCGVMDSLEISPSKSQKNSPIYHGGGKSAARGSHTHDESGFHGGAVKTGKKIHSKSHRRSS